jgi:hypothetical protein
MATTTEQSNKALVLEAFDTLFNKRDYAAAERLWSPSYIQHSTSRQAAMVCLDWSRLLPKRCDMKTGRSWPVPRPALQQSTGMSCHQSICDAEVGRSCAPGRSLPASSIAAWRYPFPSARSVRGASLSRCFGYPRSAIPFGTQSGSSYFKGYSRNNVGQRCIA